MKCTKSCTGYKGQLVDLLKNNDTWNVEWHGGTNPLHK